MIGSITQLRPITCVFYEIYPSTTDSSFSLRGESWLGSSRSRRITLARYLGECRAICNEACD